MGLGNVRIQSKDLVVLLTLKVGRLWLQKPSGEVTETRVGVVNSDSEHRGIVPQAGVTMSYRVPLPRDVSCISIDDDF